MYSNVGKEEKWDGPYLLRELNIKDPWGNDFVYKYPHQCHVRLGTFSLYSVGSNGVDECMSGDDIFIEP
ncbi:type II secretion system protein GspG [Pseudoalteromonas luteoviolacea]|uniref:type II secretion system protein GspG n=1 Tax=Pseudoalteromonas luteoviolacea TaxID=43657 RepID=UPI0009BE82DD